MTTTTAPTRVEGENVVTLTVPTLGWALRRTLLAIVILTVSMGTAACLLYASIEPDAPPALSAPAGNDLPLSTGSGSTGSGPAGSIQTPAKQQKRA
jgi:hypothetical protein